MSYITNSNPCCKSELDLFSTNPTNTSIISSSYTQHSPKSAFQKDQKSYEIEVSASDEYIDLNDIYLMTEVQLTNDSLSWNNEKVIGPVNNLAQSLFNKVQVSLFLGNKYSPIELDHSNYAYKAYFLDLLNYNDDCKKGWLQNGLFVKDTEGEFSTVNLGHINATNTNTIRAGRKSIAFTVASAVIKAEATKLNEGYLRRREIVEQGKGKIKLISQIHCDLFKSNKLLLNGIGMKFNFTLNENHFCLMGTDDGTITINKMNIMVRKCVVRDEVKKAHQSALQISPLRYPIKSTKMYIYAIDKDSTGNDQQFGLGKILPNKVIFGIVTDQAYQGTLSKNPFEFLSHGVKDISLIANSNSFNITMNDFDNDFSEGYHSLCDTLNYYGNNVCPISKDEYLNGNCLFGFNLNPDKGCSEQFNYIRSGDVGLKLKFKSKATENMKIVIMCEYDNQINIDDNNDLNFAVNI